MLKKEKGNKLNLRQKRFISLFLMANIAISCGFGALSAFIYSSTYSNSSYNNAGNNFNLESLSQDLIQSVVEITVEGSERDSVTGQSKDFTSAGSGVVYSKDGYIATNNHVIDGAKKITVKFYSGTSYEATLIGKDREEDLALIKINANDLKPIKFADFSNVKLGQKTICIGNSLGDGLSVTDGIVSVVKETIASGKDDGVGNMINQETIDVFRTSAELNPGDSGGGIFNVVGELMGIYVADTVEYEGMGEAIPSSTAKRVLDAIYKDGYVKGRIDPCMQLIDIINSESKKLYNAYDLGIMVNYVNPNSSAEEAGFKKGDMIVSLAGTKVYRSYLFDDMIDKNFKVGDTAVVQVNRNGTNFILNWKLTEEK